MKFFITGTDTNIGKTLVSAWLCLHSKYAYFKPIQTGSIEGTDSSAVQELSDTKIYKESYIFKHPSSPHMASKLENTLIDPKLIALPQEENIIVEGAGGIYVPINDRYLIIDLIKRLDIPVIIVCSPRLGTINHTLLTIQALRSRSIDICGVIISGEKNLENYKAIEYYGKVEILAELPYIRNINKQTLSEIPLSQKLKDILKVN